MCLGFTTAAGKPIFKGQTHGRLAATRGIVAGILLDGIAGLWREFHRGLNGMVLVPKIGSLKVPLVVCAITLHLLYSCFCLLRLTLPPKKGASGQSNCLVELKTKHHSACSRTRQKKIKSNEKSFNHQVYFCFATQSTVYIFCIDFISNWPFFQKKMCEIDCEPDDFKTYPFKKCFFAKKILQYLWNPKPTKNPLFQTCNRLDLLCLR